MEEIASANLRGFTKIVTYGITEDNLQYFIMHKLGYNLKSMLRRNLLKFKRFSIKTAVQIGLQTLDRLEALHNLGYLHLDLKPDNILLGSSNMHKIESSTLYLIDYGISKKYLDEFGDHIPESNRVPFQGNIIFASKNAFMHKEQSRRDDLISLLYFLSFLFSGQLVFIGELNSTDPKYFQKVSHIKCHLTVD